MANTTTRIPGTTNATVAGIFRDESKAERAVDDLKAAGFSDKQIGIATSHQEGKVGTFWNRMTDRFGRHEHTEHSRDLEESLNDSGIPEYQARYFNSALEEGAVLVTVHGGPEQTTKAVSILQQNGADIGSTAAEWQGTRTSGRAQGMQRIQLLGEILRIHKERVSRGEVRLRKEVVTERQNIEVPTTREELVVERVPGSGREASGAGVGSGEKEIRVPLSEERVHVEKKPVVNEEVHVGKRTVGETKRVADQVRHEELRTETEGNVDRETVERTKERTRKSA
jgi:uncharacterized protein (TIGR02271 family)